MPRSPPPVLQGDYYALTAVNCDLEQTAANATGQPITSCPASCMNGVVAIGNACTAAFNLAYVQKLAAEQGPAFNLTQFDPLNVTTLCGVFIDDAALMQVSFCSPQYK